MTADDWRAMGGRWLSQVTAMRTAFPDPVAMEDVPFDDALPDAADPFRPLRAALGYLRDELLFVRAGEAITLEVLDDEAENVAEELLALTAVRSPLTTPL